jgi:hypothetical protein
MVFSPVWKPTLPSSFNFFLLTCFFSVRLATFSRHAFSDLVGSSQPPLSDTVPQDLQNSDDGHATAAETALPNLRARVEDVSEDVVMLDGNARKESQEVIDSMSTPDQTNSVPHVEINRNGKRLRSSVTDDESLNLPAAQADKIRPRPLKRQNTGLPSPTNDDKMVAGKQLQPSLCRSETSQDRIDRQSVAMMLNQAVDDIEQDEQRLASASVSPRGPQIPTPPDTQLALIAQVGDTLGAQRDQEADDRLAPLPHHP